MSQIFQLTANIQDQNGEVAAHSIIRVEESENYFQIKPRSTFSVPSQKERKKDKVDFRMNTSWKSRILMVDFLKILLRCYFKLRKSPSLKIDDLPFLHPEEQMSSLFLNFNNQYNEMVQFRKGKGEELKSLDFYKITFCFFWKDMLLLFWQLIGFFTFKVISSISIGLLLGSINSSEDKILPYCYSGIILLTLLLVNILDQHEGKTLTFYQIFRVILIKLIHHKISQLSAHSLHSESIGKILNLFSNDLKAVEGKLNDIAKLPLLPFPLIAVAIITFYRFRFASFIGVGYILACIPLQFLLAKISKIYFEKRASVVDQRIKLIKDILDGIRLIKVYAWEAAFQKLVQTLRNQELSLLIKTKIIQVLENSMSFSSGLVSCTLILIFTYFYGDPSSLTLSNTFSTLDLFIFLRQEIVLSCGAGITGVFELNVVISRILQILKIKSNQMVKLDSNVKNEEVLNLQNKLPPENMELQIGEIYFKNFSASWGKEINVLQNINMNLKPGQRVSLLGPMSSGKSSFFSCFIGEMPYYQGVFSYRGNIAYVEQEPYIFNMTIRENIIFGKRYDNILYNKVIEACDLNADLANIDNGDKTKLREGGTNLSGGQRSRISLARALYSEADIYFLDNPLAALDSKVKLMQLSWSNFIFEQVAKNIFEKAIQIFLKGKTILIVSHNQDIIRWSDQVIMLESSKQSSEYLNAIPPNQQSTKEFFEQQNIINNCKDENFSSINKKQKEQDDDQLSKNETFINNSSDEKMRNKQYSLKIPNEMKNERREKENKISLVADIQKEDQTILSEEQPFDDPINEIELDKKISLSYKTYVRYFSSSKVYFLIPFTLFFFVGGELAYVFYAQALGSFPQAGQDNDKQFKESIISLSFWTVNYFVFYFVKRCLVIFITNKINKNIHFKMMKSLLIAKVSYFDSISTGSIINKFSNDMSNIDVDLPKALIDSFEVLCASVVLIVTIAYLNHYFILVTFFLILILGLFFSISKNVLICSKELEMSLKSNIFQFVSNSVKGTVPLKVYQQFNNFSNQFNKLLDKQQRASRTFWYISKAFSMYVVLASQISAIIGINIALSSNSSGSNIGQIISFFISLSLKLQAGLRQIISLDVVMASVERLLDMMNVPSESSKLFLKKELSGSIFDKGEIEFQNVHMRYRHDLQPSLNGVSFKIQQGKKVGIVGRTGAGKSSIVQALFRMFDIIDNRNQIQHFSTMSKIKIDSEEKIVSRKIDNEGQIKIDGKSIYDLEIHVLRNNLSIIPQIPFIFSGTIRQNLDPLCNYSDEEIWQTLKDINLKNLVQNLSKGLSSEISNNSEIFSAGQKQLMCLGRAILKKSKILVLDEATSNCDLDTENLIQQKIKQLFSNVTVICIAHRLLTIAEYDEIIVLDKGQIVEKGPPILLVQKEDGIFKKMVQSTGERNEKLFLSCQEERTRLISLEKDDKQES